MTYDAAIIGDGFSGLMAAAHATAAGRRVYWAGRSARPGRGTAYSTTEAHHLLNVQADRMGAWADRPGDFWRWLNINHPGQFAPDDYVPRKLYGSYLDTIRTATGLAAHPAAITGAARQETGWKLTLENGQSVECSHLVLAQGNPPPGHPGWPDNHHYVPDFWDWRLNGGHIEAGDGAVVIAGAGLTMADAALSILADGHKGEIIAISPHGRMPAVHEPLQAHDGEALINRLKKPCKTSDYFEILRQYINLNSDENWRSIVDCLRPHLTGLWTVLPEEEKARFMRHVWSVWNIHRHRMAPVIAAKLQGRVRVVAGRIVSTAADGTVTFRPRGSRSVQTVQARKVLNCMGPGYRRMLANDPLLADLLRQGHIKAGPLGLGIETPQAAGLHAIGTLLLGEKLETTAIPELRVQAAEIGKKI